MRRLTLFSFFDPDNQIDSYVIYFLKELNKYSDIIFSADNYLEKKELDKIKNHTLFCLHEKHGEYDFGSHKRSFDFVSKKNILKNYDILLLINDSCYGPFQDLNETFNLMENMPIDFWGYTLNNFHPEPHLQSYFISLNRKVFLSKTFREFMQSVKKENSRKDIIKKYEHGLTKQLNAAGFKYGSVFQENENDFKHDPARNWEELMKKGFPFLKRSLLTRNPYHLENLEKIPSIISLIFPNFEIKLIDENLKKYKTYLDTKKKKLTINHFYNPYILFKIPFWYKQITKRIITFNHFKQILIESIENKLSKEEIKNKIWFYKKH